MSGVQDSARWIVNELAEAKRLARDLGTPQLGTSSIESGKIEEYDAEGVLVQVLGEQHDGTHTTVTVNGPVPPEPMPPTVTAGFGSVEVRASGKFVAGEVSPMDLSHFSVHASRAEMFTPTNETQRSTIQGESGDLSVILLEPGQWSFSLVAVSKAGKWSRMSDVVTVEVPDFPSPVDIQDELLLLDEKYDGVITESGLLGDRLDQAETDLTAHGERLAENDTTINNLTGTVLPQLQTDLTNAKEQLAPLPGLISDNTTKVNDAKTRLDTLNNTTLPGLSDDLADAKTRLTAAEGTLAPLPGKITAAEQSIGDAFEQIDAVDTKATDAKSAAATAQETADAAITNANEQIAQIIARGQSLVRNGDFEKYPDGWPFKASGDGIELTTAQARSGANSMKLGPSVTNRYVESDYVPTSGGRTYYFELWAKREPGDASGQQVGFVYRRKLASGSTPVSTAVTAPLEPISDTVWTKVSGTFTIPTTETTAIRFGPSWRSPSSGSGVGVYVDDVMVVDVTEAQEALKAAADAQTTATNAQTLAGTAKSTADSALTMAGSKSVVYYSTSTPSGTGVKTGDVWRRIDADKNVIGEWYWTGSIWQVSKITSESIANLDVGKLTTSTAVIDSAVINKLAVNIATVIELNASRITAGKITAAQIDVTSLAVSIASVIKLNASAITAGTIDAARLDVNALSASIATIISLNASRITAGTINTARLNVSEIAASVATVISLNASRITSGTISTARLNAVEIAAATAAFQTVDVKNLFATTGTMAEAVITKLWADVVMSRKATFNMLAVGDFQNYIATGLGYNDEAIDWASGLTPDFVDVPPGLTHSFKSTVGQGTKGSSASRFDVVPGDEYEFVVWVKASVPNSRIYIEVRDQDGAHAMVSTRIDDDDLFWGNSSYPVNSAPVPTTWTKWRGRMVPKPGVRQAYIASIYFNHSTGSETNAQVWIAGLSVKRRFGGEVIIDGSLKAKQIDVQDLAASTGFIADLTSRIVKSDMFVGKSFTGGTFTGSVFQTSGSANVGLKLDNVGLRVYGPDGGEPVTEIRSDGGTVYSVTDPLTGDVLAAIDPDGGVTAQTLSVSGESRMDGVVVINGDPLQDSHLGVDAPGEWGPVINGRSLLGTTFTNYVEEHPAVSNVHSWLTPLPHGVIANAWNNSSSGTNADGKWVWNGVGGEDDNRMMLVSTQEFISGRMYSITYKTCAVRATDSGSGTVGAAILRVSSPGGAVSAGSGSTLAGSRIYIPGDGTYFTPSYQGYFRCPEDVPAGRVMLGAEVYVYQSRTAESTGTADARRWEIAVADMGLRRPSNDGDVVNLRKQGTATPPAPTPTAPEPKQYTYTASATWWQAYEGDNTKATHSTYSGAASQGRSPYVPGNGVMRGLIGFPSQQSRLSGATVKKIEVYVYSKHWHSSTGGTACIGVHNHSSTPSTWSSTTNDVKRQKMKKPEGRWITLPSSVHAGFKAGTLKGISFLPPSSSTSSAYYGLFTGSKSKLRVTYTK